MTYMNRYRSRSDSINVEKSLHIVMATETAKSHNKIHSQKKGCSHLQKSITVCRKNNKKTYPSSPLRLDKK